MLCPTMNKIVNELALNWQMSVCCCVLNYCFIEKFFGLVFVVVVIIEKEIIKTFRILTNQNLCSKVCLDEKLKVYILIVMTLCIGGFVFVVF